MEACQVGVCPSKVFRFVSGSVINETMSVCSTTCILVHYSAIIYWKSPFVVLGVLGLFCRFYSIFDGKS